MNQRHSTLASSGARATARPSQNRSPIPATIHHCPRVRVTLVIGSTARQDCPRTPGLPARSSTALRLLSFRRPTRPCTKLRLLSWSFHLPFLVGPLHAPTLLPCRDARLGRSRRRAQCRVEVRCPHEVEPMHKRVKRNGLGRPVKLQRHADRLGGTWSDRHTTNGSDGVVMGD